MATRLELPKPSSKTRSKPANFDLLRHNLGMAAALEQFLAPAYGPGGRAKLFLDPKGKPVPTTDGARMFALLDSPHPVGKIIAAVASSQDKQWRDGTKLAALLALRLLRRAEPLLDRGVRPARIIRGYEIGLERATEALVESAETRDAFEEGLLPEIARGSLGAWLEPAPREELARQIAIAAKQVAVPAGPGWRCDRRDIHVFAKGRGGFSVQRVDGYVLSRSRDDATMPARVEDARIALLDAAPIRGKAGIHEPRLRWIGDTKIRLKSPSEAEAYGLVGEAYTEQVVAGLRRSGANVVLCRLGISDYGHKLLAKAGILGIRRIMRVEHMEDVARATGAGLIKDFHQVSPDLLGRAGLVEERKIGDSKCLVIDRCANPRVVSLLISAPGDAAAEQYEALARKAIASVAAVIEDPRVVPGGAGAEIAASLRVRRAASGVEGREQLAVEAFGRSLEDVTGCLAANLGLPPRDAVLALRAACAGGAEAGLLAEMRGPADTAHGLFREPFAPRVAAWRRAMEAARTILRADDFHKVSGRPSPEAKAGEKVTKNQGEDSTT